MLPRHRHGHRHLRLPKHLHPHLRQRLRQRLRTVCPAQFACKKIWACESLTRASRLEIRQRDEGELWLKKQEHHQREIGRRATDRVPVEIVHRHASAGAPDPAVHPLKGDLNFFGARKSANSAWEKSRTSITRTTGCSASLSRKAARSCPGG